MTLATYTINYDNHSFTMYNYMTFVLVFEIPRQWGAGTKKAGPVSTHCMTIHLNYTVCVAFITLNIINAANVSIEKCVCGGGGGGLCVMCACACMSVFVCGYVVIVVQ